MAPDRQIEVHRGPAGERFTDQVIHGPGGALTSAAVPEVVLDLDALFVK